MKKNVVQSFVIVLFAVVSANVWGEEVIYKCKNQQGILIYQNSACKENAETMTSWVQKEKAKPVESDSENGEGDKKSSPVLKLKQNSGGHYATDASVDGTTLNFVVDTGASFISLPEDTAHSAQIYCGDKIDMKTANGNTDACTAKIKELKFGPFLVKDVAAVIVPNLSQPLLGMNVLQLFKVSQDKGEMQISIAEKEETKTK